MLRARGGRGRFMKSTAGEGNLAGAERKSGAAKQTPAKRPDRRKAILFRYAGYLA